MIEIIKKKPDSFTFMVKSSVGGVLLESINFSTKENAMDTVNALQKSIAPSINVERKTNLKGDFLFHVMDKKGHVIGKSKPYSSEVGMENGIKNLSKYIK